MIERKTHELIAQKVSITDVADFLGLKPEKGYAQCPFCGSKGKTLMLFKESAYCLECHNAGSHADLVQQARKLQNEEEAIEVIQAHFGFRVVLTPAQRNKAFQDSQRAQDVERARTRIAHGKRVLEGDREMVKRWDDELPQRKAELAKAKKESNARAEKWLDETIKQTTGALQIYARFAYSGEYNQDLANWATAQIQLLEKVVDHLKRGEKPAQDFFSQYVSDAVIIRAIKTYNLYGSIQAAIESKNSAEVATHILGAML